MTCSLEGGCFWENTVDTNYVPHPLHFPEGTIITTIINLESTLITLEITCNSIIILENRIITIERTIYALEKRMNKLDNSMIH